MQGDQRALPAIAPGCRGVVTPKLPLPDSCPLLYAEQRRPLRQIARKALEPPGEAADADERVLGVQRALPAGVPSHWGVVRCGCVEGVLATAILAGQHADVWDAAALLLREHCVCATRLNAEHRGPTYWGQWVVVYVWYCFRACRRSSHSFVKILSSRLSLSTCLCTSQREFELFTCAGRDLSTARQEALQATLEAAAKQMNAEERQRPGPGPPPLLAFVRALALSAALRPRPVAIAPSNGSSSEGLEAGRLPGSVSPFIYNPSRVCAFPSVMPRYDYMLLETRS